MSSPYTHFIIRLVGVSRGGPRKCGDFLYTQAFNAHVYQGQAFPIERFNAVVNPALAKYKTYMPRLPEVVLLESVPEPPAPRKAPPPPVAPAAEPAPPPFPATNPPSAESIRTFWGGSAAAEEPAPEPEEAPEPAAPAKKKAGRPRKTPDHAAK